jgi:hypothetical protein
MSIRPEGGQGGGIYFLQLKDCQDLGLFSQCQHIKKKIDREEVFRVKHGLFFPFSTSWFKILHYLRE